MVGSQAKLVALVSAYEWMMHKNENCFQVENIVNTMVKTNASINVIARSQDAVVANSGLGTIEIVT